MITMATICSGIGAPEVAARGLEITPIWCAEIEPFPCAVLAHHWPDVPNLGDMTADDFVTRAIAIGIPDVLVAGTPCQDFSVAGLRAGLHGARGNLTLRFLEIIDGLDNAARLAGWPGPVILWENVPGVLSDKTNAFGKFMGGLCGEDAAIVPTGGAWTDAGVVVGPGRTCCWRVLDAQYFGLAQRRRRVFVVSGAPDRICAPEVLLEFQGVRRDYPPRRETRQDAAAGLGPCLASRGLGGGGLGTDAEIGGGLIPSREA